MAPCGESPPRGIVVEVPGTSYYTGEVIGGSVGIETTREVSSRGLYVDFTGTEETVITRSAGKTTVTYRSKATIVQWRLPVRGEESIQPGTYRYPFQFQIPLHALPSYAGRHASVKYILAARLDVPSSYRGTYSYYSYVLHVGLDIAFGFDIIAQTPIVIVR